MPAGPGSPASAGVAAPPAGHRYRAGRSALGRRHLPFGRYGTKGGACPESVLVHDYAAHVLAVHQVVVALVHLVERVRPGDDLVELDVSGLVEAEDLGDVGGRVAVPEEAADDALAEQGQDRARQLDGGRQ